MSHVDDWIYNDGVFWKGNVVISDICGTFTLKVDGNEMGSYSCLEMAMEDAHDLTLTALSVMGEICDGKK